MASLLGLGVDARCGVAVPCVHGGLCTTVHVAHFTNGALEVRCELHETPEDRYHAVVGERSASDEQDTFYTVRDTLELKHTTVSYVSSFVKGFQDHIRTTGFWELTGSRVASSGAVCMRIKTATDSDEEADVTPPGSDHGGKQPSEEPSNPDIELWSLKAPNAPELEEREPSEPPAQKPDQGSMLHMRPRRAAAVAAVRKAAAQAATVLSKDGDDESESEEQDYREDDDDDDGDDDDSDDETYAATGRAVGGTKMHTDIQLVAKHFTKPMGEAAKALNICPTVLKKICRKHKVRRWPCRRLLSVMKQREELEQCVAEDVHLEGNNDIREKILEQIDLLGAEQHRLQFQPDWLAGTARKQMEQYHVDWHANNKEKLAAEAEEKAKKLAAEAEKKARAEAEASARAADAADRFLVV